MKKTNEWLYDGIGAPPDKRNNEEILDAVYEKINATGMFMV